MARPISVIIDDIVTNLRELKDAIGPFARLASVFKGGDGPFPVKKAGRKPGRKPGRPKGSSATVKPATAPAKPPAAAKDARKPSPALQAQGRYMSAIRRLSKVQKAQVKKIRAEKGVEEAIRIALAKAAKSA